MPYASATTIASGSSAHVTVPFPFLDRSHVHVSVNGVQTLDSLLTWNSNSDIVLPSMPTAGATVTVRRNTPADALLIELQDQALYDPSQWNLMAEQLLYVMQEAYDAVGDAPAFLSSMNSILAACNDQLVQTQAAKTAADADVALVRAAVFGDGTRAPIPSDDVSAGYLSGDFWNNLNEATLYTNLRNTAGAAAWSPSNSAMPHIADLIPGLYGAWSVGQSRSVYGPTSNNFVVTRASDSTTKTITILPNGQPDWQTMDEFLVGTTGQITTIYDASGNAKNLTKHSGNPGANAPAYPVAGRRRGFMFQGFGNDGANPCMENASLSFDRQNFSLTIVGRISNTGERGILAALAGSDTLLFTPGDAGSAAGGTPLTLQASRGAVFQIVPGGIGAEPAVIILNSSASGLTLTVNDRTYSTTALPSATLTLLQIGDAPSVATAAFQFLGDIYGVWLGTALDAATLARVKAAAYLGYGIVPQLRNRMVLVGDSITAGPQLQERGWPILLASKFSPPLSVFNLGVPGATVAAFLAPNYAASLAAAVTAPSTFVHVWLGTNDLNAGTSAATAFANLQTLISQLHTANPNAVFIVGTMLPRGSSSAVETQRQIYNALIRSNYSHVADYGADPTIGAPGAQANTTYYNADLTHPTPTGAVIIEAVAASALSTAGATVK